MTTLETAADAILTDEMLARFDERAPGYDRDNRFFQEDFEELRAAGYLDLAVPTEFGGPGLTLAQVRRLQRRLAYVAPATAVAVNMHLYWTGVAADLYRAGDTASPGCSSEAAERPRLRRRPRRGRQRPPAAAVDDEAERVEGGWEITGHKIFGSLSPVWTYLGLHAMDTSDPDNPQIVHGFLDRDAPGYRIEETWDTLGMRATASQRHDPRPGVRPRRARRARVPAGVRRRRPVPGRASSPGRCSASRPSTPASRSGPTTRRSSALHERTSIALTRSMAYHPDVQHHVAEMRMNARGDRRATSTGRATTGRQRRRPRHGLAGEDRRHQVRRRCTGRLARRRHRARPHRRRRASSSATGFEQLFRDARLGRIHPGNSLLTHELVGKLSLGINPDEQPRWG